MKTDPKPFDHTNGVRYNDDLHKFGVNTPLMRIVKLHRKELIRLEASEVWAKWDGQWTSDRKTQAWAWVKFEVRETPEGFVLNSMGKESRPMKTMQMVKDFISEW